MSIFLAIFVPFHSVQPCRNRPPPYSFILMQQALSVSRPCSAHTGVMEPGQQHANRTILQFAECSGIGLEDKNPAGHFIDSQ